MLPEWLPGLAEGWHPIAYRGELSNKPLAVRLMDKPLVLFRSSSGITLLEDRCPHRNVPLSAGQVIDGAIECPYHGWRFNGQGHCTKVPGSEEAAQARAKAFPVREEETLIWACLSDKPRLLPHLPQEISNPDYDSFWWQLPMSHASIGDAIENLLDPIHSYFLHPGLVRRSRDPQGVEVEFTTDLNSATARYTEPREGMTLLQRLTEGTRTTSWGRYCAPTQVQIGFDDQRGIHALISVVFTPVSKTETRPFACFSTRKGRAPAWLKRLLIIAFHWPVLAQDLAMLKLQADQTAKFGGPDYHNGPVDMFGPVIWAGLNGVAFEPEHRQLRFTQGDRTGISVSANSILK